MSWLFKSKQLLGALGISSFLGFASSPESQTNLKDWILEMHAAQIELLKIDWGQPGFCTEWDRDYDHKTRSCGKRRKLIERRYSN